MLTHLSSERFIHLIADYRGAEKYEFKCQGPTLILFRNKEHIYEKGFRDVYEDLESKLAPLRTFEVLNNMDPEIARAYNLQELPATLFINGQGKYSILYGFISKEVVEKEVLNIQSKA